jgi:hypothetical protein
LDDAERNGKRGKRRSDDEREEGMVRGVPAIRGDVLSRT